MPKAGVYDYLPQERVIFGKPAAQAVAEEADRLGAKRVFIVATKTVNRATDVVAKIRGALGQRFCGVFDECAEHTPRESVIAAAGAARAAVPDLIVTVGGGSAIDTVKVVQICLAENLTAPDDLEPFYMRVNPDGSRSVRPVKPSPVRQIIVPTTLSGAEFSNLGGCTDTKIRVKQLYTGPNVIGRSVILDSAVTVHTPEWLWLSTGVRGVDHAVEGLCSIDANPFTDALNLQALRMFGRCLARNKERPEDLDARLESQQAVWLASSGIGRVNYGASHGIGHALGGVAGVPHGHTSCVMLPAVLRYNASVNADRQSLVAEALGRPGVAGAEAVGDLIASLGMPRTLRDVGVRREQFDRIAEVAAENFWVKTNPRTIRGPADVREILEEAW